MSHFDEHLEAAQALADRTADCVAGYMIVRALDALRVLGWQETAHIEVRPSRAGVAPPPMSVIGRAGADPFPFAHERVAPF